MPITGSNPILIFLSLATAFGIILLFVVTSDGSSYTQRVAEFSATSKRPSAHYRLTGTLSGSASNLRLCEDTTCIPIVITPRTKQPDLAVPGKDVVIFGTWIHDSIEVSEVITPCHHSNL